MKSNLVKLNFSETPFHLVSSTLLISTKSTSRDDVCKSCTFKLSNRTVFQDLHRKFIHPRACNWNTKSKMTSKKEWSRGFI